MIWILFWKEVGRKIKLENQWHLLSPLGEGIQSIPETSRKKSKEQ